MLKSFEEPPMARNLPRVEDYHVSLDGAILHGFFR